MSTHRKTWSIEEKNQILAYCKEHGVSSTSREFGVSSASIHAWKNKLSSQGEKQAATMSSQESELRLLRRENAELKALVAEKELTIRVKDSLLKKSKSQN